MKKVVFVVLLFIAALFIGCGGGTFSAATDNELNGWSVVDSYGYSGGNVLFAGIVAIGEWQISRTKDNSGQDSSYNLLSGAKLDKYGRHYKYKMDLLYGNSGWISTGSYGVSRDGLELNINSVKYTYKSILNTDTSYCIIAIESTTTDEYQFCKVAN